jgi:hypothetical protein
MKEGLHKITTLTQIQEFVRLWHLLALVQLSESADSIKWRFRAAGSYSSRSAYKAQFISAYTEQNWLRLWKAKVEPKCSLFLMATIAEQDVDG